MKKQTLDYFIGITLVLALSCGVVFARTERGNWYYPNEHKVKKVQTDTINEQNDGSGVTIETVVLKDGAVDGLVITAGDIDVESAGTMKVGAATATEIAIGATDIEVTIVGTFRIDAVKFTDPSARGLIYATSGGTLKISL